MVCSNRGFYTWGKDSKEFYEAYKQMDESSRCKYCGSYEVIRYGSRFNKTGRKQVFKCKDCGRRYVTEDGFAGMKADSKMITSALDLYFKGISLRKVVDHLEQFYSVKVYHSTVLRWIQKYAELINMYVEDFKPELSGIWHTDEMMIKTGGKWSWLWHVMDAETRFLLANLISKTREIKDARRLFQEAKKIARMKPDALATDGLRAYEDAFKKEFFTSKKPRTEHMRLARLGDKVNQNVIERLHGTVRERDKVMRGLKGEETGKIIVDGLKNYYNFLRPHMGLNGETPAKMANIDLELGRNRWQSIIKQSTTRRRNT
ncbi:MAG: IS6 family transposase [Candidatus Methanomethylicaceae archaeon]